MKRVFRRPSPAMVVAIVALIAALGGTAVGAGVINKKKAKNIANNVVTQRAPGLSVASAKTADNATHANSANTANDANAVNGKSASQLVRWASINSNGSLRAGFGLTSATGPTGEYFVTATTSLENCAAVATNGNGAGFAAAFQGIGPGHSSDDNSWNFHRYNSAGSLTDGALEVVVTC